EWEDDVRDWLINAALECGEVARVRAHVVKLSPELAKHYELELAIADGPAAAWPALVRAAREVVASEDKITDVDFAHSLLRAEPSRAPEARPSGLEAKVHELEQLIRDGQEERRDLRKQLQTAAPRSDEGHRARRTETEQDDDGEALPQAARGIAIPRFDRRVI